jgi:hypothetical protein
MLVDIAIGGLLILLGLLVFDFPGLAIAGAFLACMGLGLAVLFRLLGRRASTAKRRPSSAAPMIIAVRYCTDIPLPRQQDGHPAGVLTRRSECHRQRRCRR